MHSGLHVQIADALRDEIERNALASGERLVEMQLARRFGVSQGPVREALRLLEGDGLVEYRPRRGAYVRTVSAADIAEVYSLRVAIEGLAARRVALLLDAGDRVRLDAALAAMEEASRRHDSGLLAEAALALHQVIAVAARHSRLSAAWEAIMSQTRSYFYLHVRFDDHESDLALHRELVEAVTSGDPDRAEATMKEHVRGAALDLLHHAVGSGVIESPNAAGSDLEEWSILVRPESPSMPDRLEEAR